jgi:hypothetical protein
MAEDLDTSQIADWRSIVTLIVFIVTSKCRMCLSRSYPMRLTLSLSHRYHRTFSLSYPDIRPSNNFERGPGYSECLASDITKAGPLSA